MIEVERANFAKATLWIQPDESGENAAQIDILQWFGDVFFLEVAQKEIEDNEVFELVKDLPFEQEVFVDLIFDYENGVTGESLERQYYVRFLKKG